MLLHAPLEVAGQANVQALDWQMFQAVHTLHVVRRAALWESCIQNVPGLDDAAAYLPVHGSMPYRLSLAEPLWKLGITFGARHPALKAFNSSNAIDYAHDWS